MAVKLHFHANGYKEIGFYKHRKETFVPVASGLK